ncbi:hypothetical protein MNBD_GAMMA11-1161 [hydrothermal vent metagenome]|uniref:Uncharacterized protein n=1 Tax=hydrothermal vent metagenome TaxID=652676 RepID=A0A3B0X8I3_9ZZZZ
MKTFTEQVQHNCHISDAQYAGNYTLCIYLLKMREYYRWEKQLPFSKKLDNNDIGQWLTEREALWDEIDKQPVVDLHIDGEKFNPYDSSNINQPLVEKQWVYSGGYGLYEKPVFFIGELIHTEQLDDYTLYITGRELARDLAAPFGMTQQKTIYIRRESLRRFIWEKLEESGWHTQENPLSRALACYDFGKQPEESLEKMTDNEVNTVLQHEIGEIQAGKILGSQWQEMLVNLPHSQAEIMARSVRDNIADMLSTLPALLEKNEKAQIHFYFANISSMRKMIFPSLAEAYKGWLDSENPLEFNNLISQATDHWIDIAEKMLALYRQHGDKTQNEIETLINSHYL